MINKRSNNNMRTLREMMKMHLMTVMLIALYPIMIPALSRAAIQSPYIWIQDNRIQVIWIPDIWIPDICIHWNRVVSLGRVLRYL